MATTTMIAGVGVAEGVRGLEERWNSYVKILGVYVCAVNCPQLTSEYPQVEWRQYIHANMCSWNPDQERAALMEVSVTFPCRLLVCLFPG